MKRFGIASAFLVVTTGLAAAQDAVKLTDQQAEGRQLYQQSCGVCHTKPTLTSPLFGPSLSKVTFAKGEDQPKSQIADGSPNMPGFKYHFSAAQIDAIVAYLKTQDPPPAEAKPAAAPAAPPAATPAR